jgi:hypothetical protein
MQLIHGEERQDRSGHASAGKAADDPPVDRLALTVDGRSDSLRDRSIKQIRADRGRRVEAEQQHEQRSHQRAAADAGQPHEHADEETGE